MSALRVLKNFKTLRETQIFKCSNVCFQSTEVSVERERTQKIKSRRFLKPVSNLELKPHNTSFIASIFGRSFDKEILEYPQVFEEKDIDTIINHSTAVEKFLNNNPGIALNEKTLSKLKALELCGLTIPQKYGGAGYNRTELNFLLECTGVESQIGRFIGCNEDFGCRILSTYGNEEQKAEYLPRLAEGQSFMTLAYLENDSLIDFSNFQGYAICDSENKGYILNSNKKWVHYADVADLYLVLAKRTAIVEEEDTSVISFNMFIAERNSPRVKVQKVLTNTNFEEYSFYEVSFQDAFVSEKNLLGDINTCGVEVLKYALSHNFLSEAALCCSLIKQLVHAACSYVQENKVFDKLNRGYIMTQDNLSSLTMYAYVLESVIYLLSGRFDLHENHDLFDESILAKVIAVDTLKSAIQTYIQIVGHESLLASGVLDKALNVVQYYSVMDENIEYLKMMVGSSGLSSASFPIADKVKKLRNPYNNFSFHIKELFKARKAEESIKKQYKLKEELHSSLKDSGDLLEDTLSKFVFAVEKAFLRHGSKIMENEQNIVKFAEITAYLYAITACLSRATSSICYDFPKCEFDHGIADKFAYLACHKIDSLITEELDFTHLNFLYKGIGKFTFSNKGYPVQHPLTRTF